MENTRAGIDKVWSSKYIGAELQSGVASIRLSLAAAFNWAGTPEPHKYVPVASSIHSAIAPALLYHRHPWRSPECRPR